jgi:hypothetical protein
MSLAAKLPWTHRFSGGYPGLSSQALPTDADALDYLSRMATADGAGVETGVAVAVDAFFRGLKATPGLFDAIKASCILCGARTLAGALVPIVGDAPTNVANGFVSGDYSRTSGLTGDGTSYLDSGRAADDDPQNDKHISAYITITAPPAANALFGNLNGSTEGSQIYIDNVTGNTFYRVNAASSFSESAAAATGLNAVVRSGSAEFSYIRSETVSTETSASVSPTSENIWIFARNAPPPNPDFAITTATIAFYSIGTSLSLEDLDTAVTNLINRLKFAILVGENPSGLDPDTIAYIVRGYEAGGSLE